MLKYFPKKYFTQSRSVVIVNGKRTPIGNFLGSLSTIQATQLGSIAIDAALNSAKVPKEEVNELIMGNVISAGLGQAPARQAAIKAGLKESTVCTTINKVCSSGMKSVHFAYQSIITGNSGIVVAGGMESMSLVPHYVYVRKPFPFGEATMIDGIRIDGLTDSSNYQAMGSCAEHVNKELKITREEQDEWTVRSYERARDTAGKGIFQKEIVHVKVPSKIKGKEELVTEDEVYLKYSKDKIPTLLPSFEKNGTITPANASKNADGGCAMILMDEEYAKSRGLEPIARIRGFADAEIEPTSFSVAPASAIPKLLKKIDLKIEDIDYFEINEAFASTAIANMKLLNINPEKLNVHGGAVALGHPIGMSGARIILSLINVLQCKNGRVGVAAICNGGGGASSICIERLH